jgi:hypothetical protein
MGDTRHTPTTTGKVAVGVISREAVSGDSIPIGNNPIMLRSNKKYATTSPSG